MAQDSAMLVITCSCGQRMKVPAQALGKTATCVKCGERLRISVETTDPTEAGMGVSGPGAGGSEGRETVESLEVIDLLHNYGLVDEAAIQEARILAKDFDRRNWALLIDIGRVNAQDFHALMGKQKGIASIDLPNYHIPREVLDIVPAELAYRGMFVPVDRLGKLLTLAMTCPVDAEIIKEVEETTGLRVKRMLSPFDHVTRTLSTCYPQFSKLGFATDGDIPAVVREFEPVLLSNEVARRVFALEALPPYKETVENIGAAIDAGGNGTTLRTITDLVAMDPIATLSLLHVSNSEAYGFPNRVDGLGMACTLLGSKAIHSVVSSLEPRNYRSGEGGFDFEACWRRAQFCAEAAQGIALHVNGQGSITAYTAGLLHDTGRLALQNVLPNSYGVLTKGVQGTARDEVEERAFRLPAPEAGYLLAKKWGLPAGLCEAIRFQRFPEKAKQAKDLTRTLALAVRMADAWESETSLNVDSLDNLLASLDLSRTSAIEIMRETVDSQAAESAPA